MPKSPEASTCEDRIRRTIAEISHCTDAGDYDGWVNLFTEDGAFHIFGQSFTGHAALRAFIEADQPPHLRGLHLTTDSVIDVEDECATVRSNFIFIAPGESAGMVVAGGWYQDILVPRGDRWLFREREATLFGPIATQNWGARGVDRSGVTPWFAVTRATPPEQREPLPPQLAGMGEGK